MQEVFKNGSEGKVYVKKTIEDLIPYIKKSLENPDVKFVKVFRAKKENCLSSKEKKGFSLEEQKRSPLDELVEKFEEGDRKELKKAGLKIPRKK